MAELKLKPKLKILLIVLSNRTQRIFRILPLSDHDLFYPAKPQKDYFYSPATWWQVRLWYRLSPKEGHDKIQNMSNFNGKLLFSFLIFFSATSETEHLLSNTNGDNRPQLLVPVTVTGKSDVCTFFQFLYILKHHLCS